MSATEASRDWTEVRPSNRHESVSEVRERVIQEGLRIFDRADFTIGRKIGEGGQGTIYEATSYSSFDSRYLSGAVKKFKLLKGVSQGHCVPPFWDPTLLNVCKPHGFFFDHDDCLCMFMPLYSTDLRTLIDSQVRLDGAPFSEEDAVSFILKLAMGFKALHAYGIYHRDIKAANVLVDSWKPPAGPEIYITDFENSANVVGTGFWRAPEILQTLDVFPEDRAPLSGKQLQAPDVYSFGMTCYEILTGRTPFDDHPWSDYNLVLSGGRPELLDDVPEPLKNLIRQCWHQNPDARPTFAEIISLLQESYSFAGDIVRLLEMAGQAEASSKWMDASPEACLAELKRNLLHSNELHTAAVDILPASAKLQRVADFISICDEYVIKFGWDSHHRHSSLPFVEYVERRRLLTLIRHQYKLYVDGSLAMEDEVHHHQDRLIESGHMVEALLPLVLILVRRSFLLRRIRTSISEDAAASKLSESELTHPDKFAIVKACINSLLDAGVSRKMTLDAFCHINNQLYLLEGASYGKVMRGFVLKWLCMTLFHPFYDSVAEFSEAVYSRVFSFETAWLYLGYKISAGSGLSDFLFGYTRCSVSGFHEVLVSYIALREGYAFSTFYKFYILWKVWKVWRWIGIFSGLIVRIAFRVWAKTGVS